MALHGNFSSYITSQLGLYCEWQGKQNRMNNSTDITLSVYFRHRDVVVGEQYGEISIDGASVEFISPDIYDIESGSWSDTLICADVVTVRHDDDGTKNNVNLSASWNFMGVYMGEAVESLITASSEINLDSIDIYNLSVVEGQNANVAVERISSGASSDLGLIENGCVLYFGDRLRISFSAADDYRISAHTVNGSTFASGGVLIVDKDIDVVASAEAIVKQLFTAEHMRCYDAKGVPLKALYQWDKDVAITIKDVAISPPPTFQFANRLSDTTIDVESIVVDNDLVVTIPNTLLSRPEAILAYISRGSGTTARTLGSIYIPVRARQRPGEEYNE